ncbi:MAG: dethiobiotin synthase [Deltaproteobacteria bacterium]|nr:dethiobiotin synthase [Deltaproteobacteria bacterium]
MSDESLWRGIVLVTGTDTGVGKTWVACGLARALVRSGLRIGVRKPAESGCPVVEGEPFAADAHALREAAGSVEPIEDVCAVRLLEPLAPGIAARRAGVRIDAAGLARDYRLRAAELDGLLVEGAGGLLVPLADGVSYADFAAALGARLLVVTGARLGAINHTLLTLEVARARGLDVAGVVVNHVLPESDLAIETLAESLRELIEVPVLASVPHGEDAASHLPLRRV